MRILLQYPGAFYVASFTAWTQKFKRKIEKGAKAIYVLVPRVIQKENAKTGEKESIIIG
ncbi:hypothetical protein AMI01nite_27180 [Aneurinibacillus migulanus]|nr:hypothetical protein AMI01nite_27180 [Aneurinibacillus migulanus]